MSSMTFLFEKFITEHEIDIKVSDLDTLVKRAVMLMYEQTKEVSSVTKEVSIKLDNPAKAQDRDDLRNCTKEILNAFCKENGLRVGGSKKEVMDRVWRSINDESSDEDISPRSKIAKEKKKPAPKGDCCGKTAKGTPCSVPGDELIGGKCYCWRHAKTAPSSVADSDESGEEQ